MGFSEYFKLWKEFRISSMNNSWDDVLFELMPATIALIFAYTALPIYLLSRIVTVAYPYWIVGYLTHRGLWSELQLFEMVMLGSMIGLHLLILLLGLPMFRSYHWLWHIIPGTEIDSTNWSPSAEGSDWHRDIQQFWNRTYSFYDSVQWMPVVSDIVIDAMGADIGPIIMMYCKAMYDAELHSD